MITIPIWLEIIGRLIIILATAAAVFPVYKWWSTRHDRALRRALIRFDVLNQRSHIMKFLSTLINSRESQIYERYHTDFNLPERNDGGFGVFLTEKFGKDLGIRWGYPETICEYDSLERPEMITMHILTELEGDKGRVLLASYVEKEQL